MTRIESSRVDPTTCLRNATPAGAAGVRGRCCTLMAAPFELFAKDSVDWNGDGPWDIVINTMSGRVYWLANVGARTDPRFEMPRPVQTHASALVSLPRSRAGIADRNGDGVFDVPTGDQEGRVSFRDGRRLARGNLSPSEAERRPR